MESREQRIATLATTLKSSGIAKSDSQARMMAEDMIGVEEHVQRDYEVEHTRAHEYLATTKNLGAPRPIIKPESKTDVKQESRQESSNKSEPSRFEELYTSGNLTSSKRALDIERSDVTSGKKTQTQAPEHDTHNSALEAIKAQISQASISESVKESKESLTHEDFIPVDKLLSKPVGKIITSDAPTIDDSSVAEVLEAPQAPKVLVVEKTPVQTPVQEEPVEEPKLDAKRLLDLMEEDGKLEEHTREIKEKPKDVKPKEAYEENNIDLGNMFDFNKGTMRK